MLCLLTLTAVVHNTCSTLTAWLMDLSLLLLVLWMAGRDIHACYLQVVQQSTWDVHDTLHMGTVEAGVAGPVAILSRLSTLQGSGLNEAVNLWRPPIHGVEY